MVSPSSQDSAPHKRTRPEPAVMPPKWLDDWRIWLVAAFLLIVPFLVPISAELRRHPVIGSIGDQLHTILFFGVTFLLYWKGPLRGRLWLTALTATVIGGGIELVQILVGRSPLFADVVLDLVGIGLAVGFILWRGHGRRSGLVLALVLLATIPIQLRSLPFQIAAKYEMRDKFPVIADFEGNHELAILRRTYGSELFIVEDDEPGEQNGAANHILRLETGPSEQWPGVNIRRFPHDWSQFTRLTLRLRHRCEGLDEVNFGVRFEDFLGTREGNWAVDYFTATTAWQVFEVSLVDREVRHGDRRLDLLDMDTLLVFLSRPDQDMVLEIDDIQLH